MSHNCSAIVSIALSTTQNIDFYTHWKVVLGYNDKITNINIREFKGPTDKLRWFDYIHLTAVSDLYRGKIKHQEIDDVRLFTIASAISKNYQEFFRINKLEIVRKQTGLYEACGKATYEHYVLVLNELKPDKKNELLLFFSSKYHKKIAQTITQQDNLITLFLLQELYQRERKKMDVRIKDEDMVTRELKEVVSRLPLEFRLAGAKPEEILQSFGLDEFLKVISPEERLRGLDTEERLKGLNPEERLKGLNPREILKSMNLEDFIKEMSVEDLKKILKLLKKLDIN